MSASQVIFLTENSREPGSLFLPFTSFKQKYSCTLAKDKNTNCLVFLSLATRQGLEPQLKASKASVLPLDDRVMGFNYISTTEKSKLKFL